MFFDELKVAFGVIAYTGARCVSVGSVAFDDCAADLVDNWLYEFRFDIILVTFFAGMEFRGDLAGQGNSECFVDFDYGLRADFFREVNFGFWHRTPFLYYSEMYFLTLSLVFFRERW